MTHAYNFPVTARAGLFLTPARHTLSRGIKLPDIYSDWKVAPGLALINVTQGESRWHPV